MEQLGRMLSFNPFDRKWYTSPIVSADERRNSSNEKSVPAVTHKDDAEEREVVKKYAKVDGTSSKDDTLDLLRSYSYIPGPEEMKKVFEKFDENSDGVICIDELGRFMKKLGFEMSQEDVEALVKTVDNNCNGSVDFDEFYSLYSSLTGSEDAEDVSAQETEEKEHDDNLRHAFEVFDKDNDGFISVEELQSVLVNLGLKEGGSMKKCSKMIENVDVDGDGKVNFEEFKKMMISDSFPAL